MISNSKRSFRAVAVACAVVLTCASAQVFTSSVLQNNRAIVYAEDTLSYTTAVNEDGQFYLTITKAPTTDTTVSLTISGGKTGYSTSVEIIGYWDSTANKWVAWTGANSSWTEQTFDSSGKLTIDNVTIPANINGLQIMVTYCADWSSGKEVLVDQSKFSATMTSNGTTIKPTNSSTSSSGTTSSGTDTSGTDTSGSGTATTYPMKDGAECGWEDITAGTENTNTTNLVSSSTSGSTKTVTVNQGGQWYANEEEGIEPIILDQTWKPEVAGQYDTDRGNYDSAGNLNITNSNNFMLSDDLGIPTNATINHFRFTFESDTPMYKVQFGAGISVKEGSEVANSGAKDEDGNIKKKIWFNESGTYDPTDEDDYSDITNENGKSYYGLNTLDTYTDAGTNYLQAQWNLYDDVKENIQNDAWSSVSVQYWYGVDKNSTTDWTNPVLTPQQVNITEAIANYDVEETYDYTDTVSKDVNIEAYGDMAGVKFSDLGLGEGDKPKAVTIKVKGASDLGKLVGAFGVSVNDECPTDDLESANWYQSSSIVYEDCASEYTITWVIPSSIAKYISPEYDAEVKFGAWYAGSGDTSLSSVTIESISVDYYSEPEVTTAATTEATTTTTAATTTAATTTSAVTTTPVTTTAATTTTTSAVTTTPVTTTTQATTTTTATEPIVTTTQATTTEATTTTTVTTTQAPVTSATTTTTANTDTDTVERKWGDVNVDGQVNAVDLVLLKKYLLTMVSDSDIPEGGLLNADVKNDDNINSVDLLLLKKYLLTMIEYSALGQK
jgi:hypothetical protein